MEGHCSTCQSTQWDVVPMEDEEEEEAEEEEEEGEGGGVGGRIWRVLVADRKKWKDIV